jgi:hypothetical protein
LNKHFQIKSSEFVPYEGQLLILFKAIGMDEATASDIPELIRWYWATGFNEALRGKPDHYVVRAVQNWRALLKGEIRGLEPRLKISSQEFRERRVVSSGALTATFFAMSAVSGVRSFVNGDIVDPRIYMSKLDAGLFAPILFRD